MSLAAYKHCWTLSYRALKTEKLPQKGSLALFIVEIEQYKVVDKTMLTFYGLDVFCCCFYGDVRGPYCVLFGSISSVQK